MSEIKPVAWLCKDYPPFLPKGEFAWRLTMDEPVNCQGDALVLHSDHEAVVDSWVAALVKLDGACLASEQEVARLRAEVEKDRVDAGRYRWLRDRAPDEWGVWRWIDSNSQLHVDDSSMDREIDAAMGEGK